MTRHIIRIFSLCTLFSLMISMSALAAPIIAVDQPVFDFGTIQQGKKVDHVFRIRNRGDSPLSILRTRTSCGCTAANISSRTIEPGKSVEMKVTFDSTGFGGKVNKTISIESNDPATPTMVLTMKGTIAEDLTVNPRQINLGQTKAGNTREVSLALENHGEGPIRILSVKTPMPQVKAVVSKQLLKPGEKTQITVTVSPRAEDRFLSGFLVIATDIPGKPEITVPIYGSVAK